MTTQPSSIGAIGKPQYDTHNNRVKGFYATVVEDVTGTGSFLEEAKYLMSLKQATRLTARFVTPSTMESYASVYGITVETKPIPLSGSWKGHWILYLASNSIERVEPQAISSQEDRIIADCLETARRRDPLSKANQNGYKLETARGVKSDRDVARLHQLYTEVYKDYVFPLTEDGVAQLVQNPNSITALARNRDGRIASVAVAELVEIKTDKGLLRISEISDEATHPDHRGNGLNQACVHTAVEELLKVHNGNIHLIYAENRATSRGVNQQSANLGWNFAGRLNRAGRIDADRDIEVEGPYEDLNVWYYPLQG